MKIKREAWAALNAKVAALEEELRQTKRATLMDTETGAVLVNVVVPMILAHLNVESRHGFGFLLPLRTEKPVRSGQTVGRE